jgi:hypothetical protein
MKTVVVIGSARTKTSVIAGIIHYLGVNMNPKDNTTEGYPFGSFEDEPITFVSAELKRGHTPERKKTLLEHIKIIMEERNKRNIDWGWKTPATHKVFEYFRPYIINPHFVVIVREPLDHAASIQRGERFYRNNHISFGSALRIVYEDGAKLAEMLNKHKVIPRIYISCSELTEGLDRVTDKIAHFLKIIPGEEAISKIKNLYKPFSTVPEYRSTTYE